MKAEKTVYLMRGLPSSGKSYTAGKLTGDTGIICETDEYFHTQVGDDPARYDYQPELLEEARRWNFDRFKEAVHKGITPIVVDRGNGLTECTQIYARYVSDNGYEVELKEPESEWWQEIRILLKYKQHTRPILRQWADILSKMSESTHRVSAAVIWRRMGKWKFDLTVDDILTYTPKKNKAAHGPSEGQLRHQRRDGSFSRPETGTLEKNGEWVGEFLFDAAEGVRSSSPNDEIVVTIPVVDEQPDNTGESEPLP